MREAAAKFFLYIVKKDFEKEEFANTALSREANNYVGNSLGGILCTCPENIVDPLVAVFLYYANGANNNRWTNFIEV